MNKFFSKLININLILLKSNKKLFLIPLTLWKREGKKEWKKWSKILSIWRNKSSISKTKRTRSMLIIDVNYLFYLFIYHN
jgi:hypothetical protein